MNFTFHSNSFTLLDCNVPFMQFSFMTLEYCRSITSYRIAELHMYHACVYYRLNVMKTNKTAIESKIKIKIIEKVYPDSEDAES